MDGRSLRPGECSGLKIKDMRADSAFRKLASELQFNPDDQWVGGYVEHAWATDRHFFDAYFTPITGSAILEIGCNVGATAIVLAAMGARVIAIDINLSYVELAKLNAKRYGLEKDIRFLHIPDATDMPFDSEGFDFITCCSMFEYIGNNMLERVKKEIDDRVVKKTG